MKPEYFKDRHVLFSVILVLTFYKHTHMSR